MSTQTTQTTSDRTIALSCISYLLRRINYYVNDPIAAELSPQAMKHLFILDCRFVLETTTEDDAKYFAPIAAARQIAIRQWTAN